MLAPPLAPSQGFGAFFSGSCSVLWVCGGGGGEGGGGGSSPLQLIRNSDYTMESGGKRLFAAAQQLVEVM